jgi:hypothetical protein
MSAATLSTLTNPEVIAVNQDPLGVQGKKVAFSSSRLPTISSQIVATNCSLSSSVIEPKRTQWSYGSYDGTIRSIINWQYCLSINNCNSSDGATLVLNECHVNDPQAPCQGLNQQWSVPDLDQTIISQMNGKW